MRIGIEAHRLFRRQKHGMDIVALELIKELQKLDKVNQYFIYIKPDKDYTCISETDNFKIRLINCNFYPLWEQVYLPKAVKSDNLDLLHCTSNTAPLLKCTPLILTLHDIIYLEHTYYDILKGEGTYYQKYGSFYRKYIVPRIVKICEKVITVSEYEKRKISDFFCFDNEKIFTIYNGVSSHFCKISNNSELLRVKEKYNLPDKFFTFMGNTAPKKNTKGVLEALSLFYKQNNEGYKLIILDFSRNELDKLVFEIGDTSLVNNISLIGYVVNTDLPAIYNLSTLFLYPSLRESFGIPIIEAMACGTPVITSNTSSMPEIAQDAALFVNPLKPEEIKDGIVKIITNNEYRLELIEKGYKQSYKFSWKEMAEKVLKIYNNFNIN